MGEADRRLTFFTETFGVVGVVAKAAHRSRKRFGGALQKYFLLDVAWSEEPGRMPILASAAILESFWDIVADWEKVRYADYLLELVSSLFPQPGPKARTFAVLLAGVRALAAGPVLPVRRLRGEDLLHGLPRGKGGGEALSRGGTDLESPSGVVPFRGQPGKNSGANSRGIARCYT